MKTAMNELVEWIKSKTNENGNSNLNNYDIIGKINNIFIEKEKQQIVDAFDKGFGWNYNGKKFNGNEYYNETF